MVKILHIRNFKLQLDQQIENQKKQTGTDFDDSQIDQLRDQVWDALVTQKIFAQLIKEYGIKVSDQEVKDVILGENPPEFLKKKLY